MCAFKRFLSVKLFRQVAENRRDFVFLGIGRIYAAYKMTAKIIYRVCKLITGMFYMPCVQNRVSFAVVNSSAVKYAGGAFISG